MNVLSEENGDKLRLTPVGKLDTFGAQELELQLLRGLRSGIRVAHVDLSQVTFLGSAGIRFFIQYYKQMKANLGSLSLSGPNSSVRTVLNLSGISEALEPTSGN